ncbi:OLC1v1032840C1 [Oldenlandia corymbosa var. corymbosa]|uniref:OLC1v1032840C1 n=1 Tax=Oldenlandia corymbosa var. corymbosa TaxID=529605 RepID=A0AAV1CPX4_OLDCO|nr:OLC1v1032840C1 [Oldenlandia corymbosa var. corymbosa]
MMKRSRRPAADASAKYEVKLKSIKLEMEFGDEQGIYHDDDHHRHKVMGIKLKWKGEPAAQFGIFPAVIRAFTSYHQQRRKAFTNEKPMVIRKVAGGGGGRREAVVEWDHEFESSTVCSFTVDFDDRKFGRRRPWELSFSVLHGFEKKKKKTKIGKAILNLAEFIKGSDDHRNGNEAKLPINLNFEGASTQATLLVRLDIVEIKDYSRQVSNSVESSGLLHGPELKKLDKPVRSKSAKIRSTSGEPYLEPDRKIGIFSWKKMRLSFKSSTITTIENDNNHETDVDPPKVEEDTNGSWESKEITSRDGLTKLKTDVFFASFDQCSNKAAGEGACTALVAFIAHWLHVNNETMPNRPEFNDLILQGSSEWRKLCENEYYTNDFPNKHFDLETVLRADIRPISISRDDSFVGFFGPEKFETLKGAMSFNDIWDGIVERIQKNRDGEPGIYIVSWNDHFFVLKVESNAYYIIDTLGERLFEGCNQAYILKFDDSSSVYGTKDDQMEMICSGKECCKEFINRFLAAIPIMELETEEEKGPVSYYSLHHRLQIELNSTVLLSSLKSSPFSSSSNNSDESSCSTDECI